MNLILITLTLCSFAFAVYVWRSHEHITERKAEAKLAKWKTKEEKAIREKLNKPRTLATFSERDQFIIENLVRKSMVSKIKYKNTTLVVNNEL